MARSRTIALAAAALAALIAGVVIVNGAGGTPDAGAATAPSAFPLADPDTLLAKDGTYVTYGTTVGAGVGSRCGDTGKLYVPYLNHGSGDTVGMTDCAAGDALPSGPGSWAEPGDAVWAPGVALFDGTFYMYYAATKKGTGQKCIGLATSGGAKSPFTNKGEWACPDGGRWAIDPDPFVASGKLYVAYRDDAIASGAETGISIVQVDGSGFALWNTRRDALKSTDISWDTTGISGSTHVVENPSVFVGGENHYYLAYSGNNWNSARYATGIADCGTSPIPSSRCTPIHDGVKRPFFGYTGSSGLSPYRGLPGNYQGPGAMDVFTTAGGRRCVVWAWWDPATGHRHPRIGELSSDANGFLVK